MLDVKKRKGKKEFFCCLFMFWRGLVIGVCFDGGFVEFKWWVVGLIYCCVMGGWGFVLSVLVWFVGVVFWCYFVF